MAYLFGSDQSYAVQTAGKAWSYHDAETASSQVLRFELRPGDHWRSSDGSKERAEVSSSSKLAFGQTYVLTYDMKVESGSRNTEDNIKVGQLHGSPDDKDSGNLGPVFALQLDGERLRVVVRSDAHAVTTSRVDDHFVYTDKSDLVRDHWYAMKVVFKLDPFGDGHLEVWRDNLKLADYSGPLGYNDVQGPYWKEGIYRDAGDVTLAVDYRNTMLTSSSSATFGHTLAPSPPAPILGTTGSDHLILTGASETVYADGIAATTGGDDLVALGGGNDIGYGGRGADTLQGAAGNDVIYGEQGRDIISGGSGSDQVSGGAGDDVFIFDRNFGQDTISDFSPGSDRIQLSQDLSRDFDEVRAHAEQDGHDVVLSFDHGETLRLVDVTLSKLTDHDFIFS